MTVTCVRARRAELKAALELDRVMTSAAGGQDQAGKPSLRTLASLAFAVGLPFIGFGFFDNFIMVRCPDRLTLAAAMCLTLALGQPVTGYFGQCRYMMAIRLGCLPLAAAPDAV